MEILDTDNIRKQSQVEYANFGHRLLASLVDFLVIAVPIGGTIYFGFMEKNMMLMLMCTIITGLYKPLMEGTFSATVGKMVVGIKMVDSDYENLDLVQSFTKNGIYLISSAISVLSAFWMFGVDEFLDAEGFLESSMAAQGNPYQLISSIWGFVILISCFMMLASDKKQTLHDRIASTFCIRN
ncbi:MAG: putative RDD family membrane protein YckC [Saprospiraceae bacterium]|jgi:uncharacterized RDD family membrane protein YckC